PGEVVRLDDDAVELVRELAQRLPLELADTLTRDAELLADLLERDRLAVEAVPHLDDPPLPLGQLLDRAPDGLAADGIRSVLRRIGHGRIAEQVAELAVAVGAHARVQRDGRLRRVERLVDVLHREAGRLCELLAGRLATQLRLKLIR